MRPVEIGGLTLFLESPEAARYLAPILIVPGLFHSSVCLRGMTSMLAHRGWEVYLLPRVLDETTTGAAPRDQSWEQAVAAITRACSQLGDEVIILAADIGASLTLAALPSMKAPLALALFAPAAPQHIGESLSRGLGFFGRRRLRRHLGRVAPEASLACTAYQKTDIADEPHRFVKELLAGVSFVAPAEHPPTIVFVPDGSDPLVSAEHARGFAATDYAKTAPSQLHGRWWPSLGWDAVCQETHRFLILTLSDRVVEFPDEIISDD